MKSGQIFSQLASPVTSKYIPTPESASIIINYFVYNNFQDFNTWQQIAKTKIDYDYFQNSKGAHVCKVVLKWEDRTFPTFIESAEAKTKKEAKKRALKRLIQSIIHQGYINLGFKDGNFVEKLPRRRKNDSDNSDEEESEEKYTERPYFLSLLKNGNYQEVFSILANSQLKWKEREVIQSWRHGLSIKSSLFLQNVIRAYRGESILLNAIEEESESRISNEAMRQFSYGRQVNGPLREELTDFIRYQQLQKAFVSSQLPLRQPELQVRPIPSENVLKEMTMLAPSRQMLALLFHPIEGRKIFLPSLQKNHSQEVPVELPRFEREERDLTLNMTEEMYGLLLYYSLDYEFVERVVKMMREEIKAVDIVFEQSMECALQERGGSYYLNFKNLLTAEFCHLLHGKFASSSKNVSIQGMVVPLRHEEQVFAFNCKQPQEIVNKKVNRRANFNQFDEMQEISLHQVVALVSKIDSSVLFLGQVVELSPLMKVYVPEMSEDGNDPEPFTMVRIYNSKIFDKTSSSIIRVSRTCMKLLQQHTTIIWQPPSFPVLSVISELLIEWLTIKSTVLIVSLDSQVLHSQLTSLGFKVAKITQRTEDKVLAKCSIVVVPPSVACCDLLKNYAFSRVLLEGAHQMSEISCLGAIVKGCQEVYLMGDPFMPRMQVASPYSHKHNMGISLLQRLYNSGAKTQTYISRLQNCFQFRNVMEWPDKYIYNRKLMLFGNQIQTPTIKGFPWPSIDHRVCFLHHPSSHFACQSDYINQQAYICAVICGAVAKSGYTKLQQITCSAATRQSIPFLQKHMGALLRQMNLSESKLFKKHMAILCRMVSGSIYFRNDLSILMLGKQREQVSFREILGAMREGRRGVIVIGDLHYFAANRDVANFIDWCKQKKLINRVETQFIATLF